LVYMNMKKAYDSISHKALLQVLRDYGTNEQFVKLIANLYQECQVRLKINGELLDGIPYGRGVFGVGELVGILVALKHCPLTCNLEMVVDCTSAIKTIAGFNLWKKGRQMHTEGQGVVQHITQLIQERKELGFEVSFTYVPSHVEDKGKKAAAEGAEAEKV